MSAAELVLSVSDVNEWNVMDYSILYSNQDIIEMLLQFMETAAPSLLRHVDSYQRTYLHKAAYTGNSKLLQLLLRLHLDINAKGIHYIIMTSSLHRYGYNELTGCRCVWMDGTGLCSVQRTLRMLCNIDRLRS
jgi:hypothetical protein